MYNEHWDDLWLNGLIAPCEQEDDWIEQGALATKNGQIAWVGSMQDLPSRKATRVHDIPGCTMTPGLIDCHTHLIYAGNRANEFELRLKGMSYADIAKQGGGIHSTVTKTRAATEDELVAASLIRARALLASGVTTVEIKSGYGLDWETELKMLRVADRIANSLPITIQKTFLGAHTTPREYTNNIDDYVNLVCTEMIPAVAANKLADAVDVFCETIAFNLTQTERIFAAAKQHHLAIKCHAEQLSDSGSAALAARYGALSVDHLEHLSLVGVQALAQSGTVAVLLPGAFYYLCETQPPPIELLRQHQVPIAIATDCNPGTSPIMSILLIMNMACTLLRLTPAEALAGVTRHAAKALGLEKTSGTLTVGKTADIAIWNVSNPTELIYYMGWNPLKQLIKTGKEIAMSSLIGR